MDTIGNIPVICGGYGDAARISCLHFTPASASGIWSNYASIKERVYHTSWVSSAGLVLMGGLGRGMYAEIVNVPSGDGDFSLVQDTE